MSADYSVSRAYTYQGRYPEELSHNWKSPEGEWLNLREMTDVQLAELGWFPVQQVEFDHNTHTITWNENTKSYDIIELSGTIQKPVDYFKFWDLLLSSVVYEKLKEDSKISIEVNTLITEFLILLADAKFGQPNITAIQESINQILKVLTFTEEDIIEIQSLFRVTGLDQIYTLS